MASWEHIAAEKRDSVNNLIPAAWRISDPPSRQDQRDVTGKYIQQFLAPEEIEITETDAVAIAAKTTTRQWTAEAVTTAFCHRAALAHQLVGGFNQHPSLQLIRAIDELLAGDLL